MNIMNEYAKQTGTLSPQNIQLLEVTKQQFPNAVYQGYY